uniref:SHSS3124 n=1 Tax=Homo sapiens TaxID=9606 RepID=Q6UWJ0_HUMAN|nr:SHSS3124 [Homo sapiens]
MSHSSCSGSPRKLLRGVASLILALSSLAAHATPAWAFCSLMLDEPLPPQCFSKTDPPEASLNVKTAEVSWLHLSCRKGGWDGPGAPRGPSPLAAFGL